MTVVKNERLAVRVVVLVIWPPVIVWAIMDP